MIERVSQFQLSLLSLVPHDLKVLHHMLWSCGIKGREDGLSISHNLPVSLQTHSCSEEPEAPVSGACLLLSFLAGPFVWPSPGTCMLPSLHHGHPLPVHACGPKQKEFKPKTPLSTLFSSSTSISLAVSPSYLLATVSPERGRNNKCYITRKRKRQHKQIQFGEF